MKTKLRTTAFVLKKQPYSESSELLQCFSSNLGLISVLAKGSRRQQTKLQSSLNPLAEYELILTQPSLSGIHTLTDVALLHDFPADLPVATWLSAQAGAELLLQLLLPQEEIQPFYDLFSKYLTYLQTVQHNAVAICWRFLLQSFRLLGIPLETAVCGNCKHDLSDVHGYVPESGQLLCADCESLYPNAFLFSGESSRLFSLLPVIGNYLDDLVISRDAMIELNRFFTHYLVIHFHRAMHLHSLEMLVRL